ELAQYMECRDAETCCERSKLIQVAIEIWICTDDKRAHFQFNCLGKSRVNISAGACLKNRSFDPKHCLSFSRLANFFGIVWIAGIDQRRNECRAWYDLVYKLDLVANEAVRHADNARNIATGLLQIANEPQLERRVGS